MNIKILFVVAKLGYTENTGIAYLSAIAKQLGHKTYFYSNDNLGLNKYVKELKPDVIAYSCDTFNANNIISINKQIKKQHNYVSIMGGSYPTFDPHSFNNSGMDVFCIGEGEYAFKEFIERVEQGKSYDDIKNLITKNKVNDVRLLINPLDQLPMPDHDLILGNTFLGCEPKKTFFTSRGCYYNCSYCCNKTYKNIYHGKGDIVRRFSVERVISEMEYVKEHYSMDFVKIDDDCFTFKADKWLKDFIREYKSRIDLPFNCLLRIDNINDDILSLLKKGNCHSLTLSIDSINHVIRENILNRHMNIDNKEIINRLKKVKEYGIETYVNFMLGLPTSNINDEIGTIDFCNQADVTYPAYTMAVPFKGTELYDYCKANNYLSDNYETGDMLGWSNLDKFNMKQRIVQRNIFLLGALLSKVDRRYIKYFIPLIYDFNEQLYNDIWKNFYDYNLENVIYELK